MRDIITARYYNSNGYAMAIVAVLTGPIDWAAYAGGCDATLPEREAVKWVADYGCKLSNRDAGYFFPALELPRKG